MKRGQGIVAAGVTGNEMQAGNRYVELGFLCVLQHQELGGLAFNFQRDQALIAADTVIDMHHRGAFAQLGEVLDDVLAGITAFFAPPTLHDPLAEQRTLGDQRHVLQQQPVVQRRDGDCQSFLAVDEFRPTAHFLGAQLQTRQQFQQHFATARRFGGEQHSAGKFIKEAPQRAQRFAGLGIYGQFRKAAGRKALAADAGFDIVLADHDAWPGFQVGEAILDRDEQLGRRQQRPLGVDTAILVTAAHILPEVLGSLLDAGQGEDLGVFRQIVEQRRGLVEEQRQVVLDTRRGNAGGKILIDRTAAEIHVEALTEARAKAGDRFLFQRKLASRQQAYGIHLLDGTLILRIERAQRFDLVVEQVDAVGQGAAHGIEVEQRAAHGELAMFVHRVHAAVARRFQAQAHLFDVELLADIQHQTGTQQKALGRQAV